MKGLN